MCPNGLGGLRMNERCKQSTNFLFCKNISVCRKNWVDRQESACIPLASSLSLWTDSSRFSFSSSSLSRKAFRSMTWFMRCSKSSRDMMVALGHTHNSKQVSFIGYVYHTRIMKMCFKEGLQHSLHNLKFKSFKWYEARKKKKLFLCSNYF